MLLYIVNSFIKISQMVYGLQRGCQIFKVIADAVVIDIALLYVRKHERDGRGLVVEGDND